MKEGGMGTDEDIELIFPDDEYSASRNWNVKGRAANIILKIEARTNLEKRPDIFSK